MTISIIFTRTVSCFACVAAAGLLLTSAYAATPKATIDASNAQFESDVRHGDVNAITQRYTGDAKVYPNDIEPAVGQSAINKLMSGFIQSGVADIKLTTHEIYSEGPLTTEVGDYQLFDKSGKPIDHGSYITIWKREGKELKMFRDMFVSSVAPAK